MFPVADDLGEGDALPDGDEVARYCSPSNYDHAKDEPSHLAFVRRTSEKCPSVNRLETFVGQDRAGAVDCIRQEVRRHLRVKDRGRFVVFNVEQAKVAADQAGFSIGIVYAPAPDQPSHSLIANMPEDTDAEVQVATAIKRLIANADVYPSKIV